MRRMAKLDLTNATASYSSGELPTGFTSTDCNTLYIINNSNLTFQVTFTGGSGPDVIGHLPNQWARAFKVNGNYQRVRIEGSDNPTNAQTAAFSYIVVESYLPSEDVSHLTDTPITAPLTFVGPAVVNATNLRNTGNPLGTNVIFVQPLGDSNATITADNSGNVTIGDATNGGTLSVVGTATFGSRVQGNGASNLRLDTGGVGRAIEFDASGVQQGFFDSNGLNINTAVNFITNSLVTGVIKGATSNNGLFFDTQSAAQTTNWGIGGVTLMQLAATFLSLNQVLQANNSIFSQGNGSVSGTLDLHAFIWGSNFKVAWIYLNGLNTASNTFVLFPSAITSGIILPGDISSGTTGQLFNGATPVGVRQGIYSTVQGSAGSSAAQTNFRAQTPNTFLGTSDRLAINTTGGAGINNGIFIIGN